MSETQSIIINSRKFDETIHRSWSADLIEETTEYYIFLGEFDKEVKHTHLGVIRRKTVSYEYYWKNRWYNVFRFHEPEGELRNFYCNVNLPPVLTGRVLNYIDLDIDILVWKNLAYEILDLNEFEENGEKYGYSPELKDGAARGLAELIDLIENRKFPFNSEV